MKEHLQIIKIGGNVLDNPEVLTAFLKQFATLKGAKILVHGGGKKATSIAKQLGIETKMIQGRRVTSDAELEIVTMVYAGLINKQLVATLQANQCNALGLSGADGNAITASLRNPEPVNYGKAGDVQHINTTFLKQLLHSGITLVFCAITHDKTGQLLNTNADTIASEIAIAFSEQYNVSLFYCFEKKGVLSNISDENSVIECIDRNRFTELVQLGIVDSGMLPKLENGLSAVEKGVSQVFISNAENLSLTDKHTQIL